MKLNLTTILFIIILLLLGGGFFMYNHYENKIDNKNILLKKEILKNDELKKISDGWYQKYVADTATISDLRKKVDSLKIETDNPTVIIETEIIPADAIKITDTIYENEGMIYIEDFYPSKDNYFLKYNNRFDLETYEGESTFTWNKITITGVISEQENGLFRFDLDTPEFIEVGNIDVISLPMERPKKDNFGILLGGGYGKDFKTGTNYLEIGGGIRLNKFYIEVEGNTNKQADIGLKYEF